MVNFEREVGRMAGAEYKQYQANGVSFEQAVHLVRGEFNVNHDVILRQLAPQEVFVQYGPEVGQQK